ncbi:MAG: peptidyl-prolyl cis-trans isomerase [Sulfurovaceae bacterium]|nr:peptidyl-prolyl cis-trans isomerase [Sulfurovaceae bacterium]
MIKTTIKIATVASLLLVSVSNAETTYGSVNGENITVDEVNQVVGAQGIKFDTLDKNTQKKVLDMIVDRKLLAQNASKSGLEKTDEFKEKLEIIKKDLALNLWMEEEAKKIESTTKESELKEFYEKNKKNFETPAELKASHILVKTEDEAKAIIKQLEGAKDVKAEFTKLAKEKSTGPSGANGGDLGWFPLDRMVPEFSDAADKLKKGKFTKEPVKTQFGYHIIYLEDRKPAGIKKFDEVKEQIKGLVNRNKFNKMVEDTVSKLKKDAKIELKK